MAQGEGGRCFSRAEPRHKQDIVRLLKEMGEVSALRNAQSSSVKQTDQRPFHLL